MDDLIERELVERALAQSWYDYAEAARALGMTIEDLKQKIEQYHLPSDVSAGHPGSSRFGTR